MKLLTLYPIDQVLFSLVIYFYERQFVFHFVITQWFIESFVMFDALLKVLHCFIFISIFVVRAGDFDFLYIDKLLWMIFFKMNNNCNRRINCLIVFISTQQELVKIMSI